MNENLNLLDILEDCPKGTKLYSSVFGEVEFDSIKEERAEYPIRVLLKNGTEVGFTSDGTEYAEYYDGECVLFPSKDQRDWSKFNVSIYKKEQKSVDKIEPRFKIGDWIITPENQVLQITSIVGTSYRFNNVSHYWETCYCDKQCRLWTIQDAKDGDVLATHECYVVFKEIDGLNIKCYCAYYHLGLNPSFYRDTLQHKNAFLPATKEQRDVLMKAINDAGYEWDEEKKELKLDGPRFAPKTLKPFDKVLVRDENTRCWICALYSHKKEDKQCTYKYVTIDYEYRYCIPYNDDTKHLVGITDEAPEYYRYWED